MLGKSTKTLENSSLVGARRSSSAANYGTSSAGGHEDEQQRKRTGSRSSSVEAGHPGTHAYREEGDEVTVPTYALLTQIKQCFEPLPLKVLLVAVPLALALKYGSAAPNATLLFGLSFVGLVPLAALLGDFTEDLCLRTNDVIGALINVTFGNATELLISIFALRAGYLDLIKMSLLGSVLSNMLLVLGTAFIMGGTKRKIMVFNPDAANTYIPLLMLSVFSFIIPSGYVSTVSAENAALATGTSLSTTGSSRGHSGAIPATKFVQLEGEKALLVSRIVAVIACVAYIGYLYFQLFTHKEVFDEVGGEPQPSDHNSTASDDGRHSAIAMRSIGSASQFIVPTSSRRAANGTSENGEAEEEEVPQFSYPFALVGIAIISILISILSDMLVDSVHPAAKALGLSRDFIGVILVPIVGNAAEHATAIIMAYKGKVDIAVGVALGSSIQISLFMMPFLVLVGWAIGVPLDMNFHPFSAAILFVSVLVAAHTVCDGRTNWLEGLMLCSAYFMTAALFFNAHVDMS